MALGFTASRSSDLDCRTLPWGFPRGSFLVRKQDFLSWPSLCLYSREIEVIEAVDEVGITMIS